MRETPIDYQLLATFVAVAEQSSFSKAARKLGVGKGTVSRAVARLEQVVGAELIHRTTHKVALSTAGIALYERTAHHLAGLDKALLGLVERGEEPSGELRLTAPHDFGATVLAAIVAQFSRRYPEVRCDIRLTNAPVDIVADGYDLAIRAAPTPMKDSTLTVRRLGTAGADFYAAPSYLARRGKPRRLGESGQDWLLHPGAMKLWKVPRDVIRTVADDFLLIRDLVREGAGVGLLPHFLADAFLREGWIELVPLTDRLPMTANYMLLYSSSGQVPRKVTAFRDFLIERLEKAPLD
jgi:DNA-binding transcriptional LysR family regulator